MSSPPAGEADEAETRAAELGDLTQGASVEVRGRRATVAGVDYPLVFFAFDDAPSEQKHRSFLSSSHMFRVPAGSAPPAPASAAADEAAGNGSGAVEEAPANPAAAMFGAFAMRPRRVEIRGAGGEDVECEAKMPQGVLIEDSFGSTVRISNKVSSLAVLESSDLTVEFAGSVGAVEVFRCHDVRIRCLTGACKTWTVEESAGVQVSFPREQGDDDAGPVSVVTKECDGVFVAAYGADADAEEDQTRAEVEPPAGAAPDAQLITRWAGGRFEATASLARYSDGHVGGLQ